MVDEKCVKAPDLIQQLRDARSAPAVLKAKLASIRAHNRNIVIFACEGIEDKTIYFHWLRQVAPFLTYEFLVCNGKRRVLEFRKLLRRDASGLHDKVYFFVDRDFDELQGQEPGPDIYMTDSYSVENHLVTVDVLDQILQMEIQCHSEPAQRERVVKHFQNVYDGYLEKTKDHNHRVYLARRNNIGYAKPLPDRINLIAKIGLSEVDSSDCAVTDAVCLVREPTEAEIVDSLEDFYSLNRRTRFRGKFAVLFFSRWLQLLGEDRNSKAPSLFGGLEKPTSAANGRLTLDALASKSRAPECLRSFIHTITGILPDPPLATSS